MWPTFDSLIYSDCKRSDPGNIRSHTTFRKLLKNNKKRNQNIWLKHSFFKQTKHTAIIVWHLGVYCLDTSGDAIPKPASPNLYSVFISHFEFQKDGLTRTQVIAIIVWIPWCLQTDENDRPISYNTTTIVLQSYGNIKFYSTCIA